MFWHRRSPAGTVPIVLVSGRSGVRVPSPAPNVSPGESLFPAHVRIPPRSRSIMDLGPSDHPVASLGPVALPLTEAAARGFAGGLRDLVGEPTVDGVAAEVGSDAGGDWRVVGVWPRWVRSVPRSQAGLDGEDQHGVVSAPDPRTAVAGGAVAVIAFGMVEEAGDEWRTPPRPRPSPRTLDVCPRRR
jgi:hypothetical protein